MGGSWDKTNEGRGCIRSAFDYNGDYSAGDHQKHNHLMISGRLHGVPERKKPQLVDHHCGFFRTFGFCTSPNALPWKRRELWAEKLDHVPPIGFIKSRAAGGCAHPYSVMLRIIDRQLFN
jgi:hypothetical protein